LTRPFEKKDWNQKIRKKKRGKDGRAYLTLPLPSKREKTNYVLRKIEFLAKGGRKK